ncbi:MAG: Mrp/NBP35 family ATP-binding protein [Thermoplasmata archaeon]|nr:Mrp/NBP35 family ATP-binding protein [Thermoplasmata archaeon]
MSTAKEGTQASEEKKTRSLKNVKHIILVLSGKGGVGKSTVATNLAMKFAVRGREVGLLDVDIHGPDIPMMLGIQDMRLGGDGTKIDPVIVPPNLKVISMGFLLSNRDTPVIWRGPLKMKAIEQFLFDVDWGQLDFLIVDLPPGTGDEALSIAQMVPESDGAIIITTPQDVALLDSRKAVNFVRTLKLPVIGIVENMSGLKCPECGHDIQLFKTGGGEKAAKEMGVPFLGRIPIDPEIVDTGDDGVPVVLRNPKGLGSVALESIMTRIEEIIEKKGD